MNNSSNSLYALGIDFGTNSVRALVMNLTNGEEVSSSVSNYKSGNNGILLDENNPLVARQHPGDYLESMEIAVKEAVTEAVNKNIAIEKIVGIGVDTTGSTPIPVDENLIPLAFNDEFKENLNAQAWLWKDHSSIGESEEITELSAEFRPEYIAKCGGSYSSEWFFSKILRCYNIDREVFDVAYTWLECSDYIPAAIAGITNISDLKRNVCAAGHKAMYSKEWGGYPDEEFLTKLAPEFKDLKSTLSNKVFAIDEVAGNLSAEWAEKFGLKEGVPIAVGAMDAHIGAIGSGVGEGVLVKVIGTSTCDIMASPKDKEIKNIPGVAGVVDGSVLPDYIGIEAGQSAVGDIFNWFVSGVLNKESDYHNVLTEKADKLKAGQSGLLSLDWNNGNRNVLADFNLTGLILGQTLHTKDYEIYRALIEATAFGALMIIERMEEYGIKIDKLVNCGGIAEKNPMVMQIYADILGKPMEVAASGQTVALGAAIIGGFVAMKGKEGFENIEEIQSRVCKVKDKIYTPSKKEHEVYMQIYELYKTMHDAFGVKGYNESLYNIMKKLIEIKKGISQGAINEQ
ncbi:MAG: ribulokinase [Melioribacteraceae bacterium]|nr:ribulokinase [Melioribacteraceae bacterium]